MPPARFERTAPGLGIARRRCCEVTPGAISASFLPSSARHVTPDQGSRLVADFSRPDQRGSATSQSLTASLALVRFEPPQEERADGGIECPHPLRDVLGVDDEGHEALVVVLGLKVVDAVTIALQERNVAGSEQGIHRGIT